MVLPAGQQVRIPLRERFEVRGDLTLQPGYTCTIELPTNGDNPVPMFVTGRVTLGGVLRLIFSGSGTRDSAVRAVPASVVIVDSSTAVTGQFDTVTGAVVGRGGVCAIPGLTFPLGSLCGQ